jgi:hypothetical protein
LELRFELETTFIISLLNFFTSTTKSAETELEGRPKKTISTIPLKTFFNKKILVCYYIYIYIYIYILRVLLYLLIIAKMYLLFPYFIKLMKMIPFLNSNFSNICFYMYCKIGLSSCFFSKNNIFGAQKIDLLFQY